MNYRDLVVRLLRLYTFIQRTQPQFDVLTRISVYESAEQKY